MTPQPQQFGVVETHPRVVGELPAGFYAGPGLITPLQGDQQAGDDGVEERGVKVIPIARQVSTNSVMASRHSDNSAGSVGSARSAAIALTVAR